MNGGGRGTHTFFTVRGPTPTLIAVDTTSRSKLTVEYTHRSLLHLPGDHGRSASIVVTARRRHRRAVGVDLSPAELMARFPTDVVILAAGNGLRLASFSSLPKPLVTIEGRALLDRVLGALHSTDLQHVKIVVGHAADSIRSQPFAASDGMDIEWIENTRYYQPNGLSLLCAEGHVRAPFVLLMADHLFEVDTLRRFLRQPCPADGAVLAVDHKLDAIYDLDDATKVVTHEARLTDIGKRLPDYDAVDTGMFLCSEAIFEAMRESASKGRESLSDGVATLGRMGRVRTWDIGPAVWIDVDTPGACDEAERLIRAGRFRLSEQAAEQAPPLRPDATIEHRPPGAEAPPPAASSRSHRSDRARLLAQIVPSDDVDLVPERG